MRIKVIGNNFLIDGRFQIDTPDGRREATVDDIIKIVEDLTRIH